MFFRINADDGDVAVFLHNFEKQFLGAPFPMSTRHINSDAIRPKHLPQYRFLKAGGFGRAFLAARIAQNEVSTQPVGQYVLPT